MIHTLARLLSIALIGVCAATTTTTGAAQLKVDFEARSPRGRADAPRAFDVTFRWRGAHILEGRISLEAFEGTTLHYRYRSDVLAIPPGESRRSLTLPPFGTRVTRRRRLVGAFRPKDGGSFGIDFVESAREARGVRFCTAIFRYGTIDRTASRLLTALTIDAVAPMLRAGGAPIIAQRDATYTAAKGNRVTQPMTRMPTLAIDYCSYDVVVVDGRGLGTVSGDRRRALDEWLRAGGRVVFLLSSVATVPEEQRAWLRGLLGPDADALADDGTVSRIVERHVGFGRAAFVGGADIADASATRRLAAFVWDLRPDLARRYVRDGTFPRVAPPDPDGYEETVDYELRGHAFTADEISVLVPVDVEPIPVWVLAMLLGALLVWVGPGELLIARTTRKGWITWVLFPLACIVATWWTMRIARRTLGQTDFEARTWVLDVTADGEALRSTTFDFVFSGASREIRTERRNELVGATPLLGSTESAAPLDLGTPDPVTVHGNYPRRYVTTGRLEQWSPQVERRFQIGAKVECPFDVPAVVGMVSRTLRGDESSCVDDLRETLGPRAEAFAVWRFEPRRQRATAVCVSDVDDPRLAVVCGFAERITRAARDGRMTVFGSMAPSGGSSIEDLVVSDGAPGRALVVLAVVAGPDVVILRWWQDVD